MKIVIFEPHPDDLLLGAGHFVFDWLKEGHDLHIITITDGSKCYETSPEELSDEIRFMSADKVRELRFQESKKVIEFLGLSQMNHHYLDFKDADGQKYVEEGIERVKGIIKDANRVVLPSKNNKHKDHQAAHDICMGAAKELNLKNLEYWVYFLPLYGVFNRDSEDKQILINISKTLRSRLLEWLQIYESQSLMPQFWKTLNRFIKYSRTRRIAIFELKDYGKYYNF